MLVGRFLTKPFLSFNHLVELLRIHIGNHVGTDLHELDHIHEFIDGRTRGDHWNVTGIDDRSHAAIFIP